MKICDLIPYVINKEASVSDALEKIDKNNQRLVFVIDNNSILLGAVTDGDIRRWLIKTGQLNGRAENFMNKNPLVIHRGDNLEPYALMEKEQVTALPLVDVDGRLLDIYFLNDPNIRPKAVVENALEVPVVIMAGGKGTRLYPYTKILPKPLIPIGDIPIMERIINNFSQEGVNQFFVTINYRGNMIKSYFSDICQNYSLTYVEEDEPLGTAGSLRLIEQGLDRPFIVSNCDILIRANYKEIYDYHIKSGNALTVISALKNIEVPYGVIQSGQNGIVNKIEEKPKLSYFVNTGMYILNPEMVDEIPKATFFHMTDLVKKILDEGKQVGMYPISEDSFLDMGEFEEMHRMEEKLSIKSEQNYV